MKYNLLIITPDQMRADYLGSYGHPSIGTSHLDALAEEGVRFENCYCAAPLCAPSRISFATSTYVGEHNHRNYGSEISPDVPNLVSALKKQGYRTGMFGKNHLFTYDRLKEVWDSLDEICLGNCDDHPDYLHSYSAFTMDKKHPYNITARLTSETIAFMKEAQEPFIAWVNYQDPHPAFACPPPYDALFDPDQITLSETYTRFNEDSQPVRNRVWRQHSEMDSCTLKDMQRAMAAYMGQVRYVDDSVGRLMDALEDGGLSASTVVLFFSDHGELLGDYGMTHKLPVFYDCLTKIPVILRHPAKKWKGTVFGGLAEEVDLAPTLLDILQVPRPPTMVGRSLAAALDRGETGGRETVLCEAGGGAPTWREPDPNLALKAPFAPTSFGPGAMLRRGPWKLSVYADDICELYNLEEDPHELHNRYNEPALQDIQAHLSTDLLKRLLGVKMRDIGLKWDYPDYPVDVRFEPLERT
jgi:arylsulfatase A-like enzyme